MSALFSSGTLARENQAVASIPVHKPADLDTPRWPANRRPQRERGRDHQIAVVPITVAAEIAGTDDEGAQSALREAYEKNQLRGEKLVAARRLVDPRMRGGRRFGNRRARPTRLTANSLVRAFRQEPDRQRLLVKKAELTRNRLVFIVSALQMLLADEHFVTLLRAEGLDSLPRYLAERIDAGGTRSP